MSKRKLPNPSTSGEASSHIHDESSSEDDTDMIDIQFEWFDPQPAHDFHGLKTLIRQLLDADSTLFDLSALAEVVLAQPLLGSTVKVDGNETDPYAFLSVVGVGSDGGEAQEELKPCVGRLVNYLLDRSSVKAGLQPLQEVLTAATKSTNGSRVGIILTERLINIPSEVVPPMYKMLLEEISWAVEEDEPYNFSHYVVLSKTYTEVESVLDDDEEGDGENSGKGKKKKKKRQRMGKDGSSSVRAAQEEDNIFYFHPEDEVLQRYATCWGGFEYVNQKGEGETDAKRTFQELGIRPQGHVILIEAGKFQAAVKAVEEYFATS